MLYGKIPPPGASPQIPTSSPQKRDRGFHHWCFHHCAFGKNWCGTPTPTCPLLAQLSAISVRPLPGELVACPPILSEPPTGRPGLLALSSRAQSCPTLRPRPSAVWSGPLPQPGHLRQEAVRGQGRHSNWSRWFYREEVDSSTSNTADAGLAPPASLSHPCPRLPTPPLLPERETQDETPFAHRCRACQG